MVAALIVILGAILFILLIGAYISAPTYRGSITDHFDGKKFINPGNVKEKGLLDVFKWMFSRERTKWEKLETNEYGPKPPALVNSGIRITFINHTTFLIQIKGLNILTDPIWSDRASPFSWAGPKRMRNPGIRFEDLPHIHAVFLSHNHYDHLDLPSLKNIVQKFNPRIFTGLGVGEFLEKHDMDFFVEMDWWQEFLISKDATLTAVPAQHFSGRGMFDRDGTLWMGFVIKTDDGNIYFAADTGYNEHTFKEIGERCAPIRVSIIPIGAYKPQWFMKPIHCSPEEAVRIHIDVRSRESIASHFGTFPLADEGRDDPPRDLKEALTKYNLPEQEFIVLKEGQSRGFQ